MNTFWQGFVGVFTHPSDWGTFIGCMTAIGIVVSAFLLMLLLVVAVGHFCWWKFKTFLWVMTFLVTWKALEAQLRSNGFGINQVCEVVDVEERQEFDTEADARAFVDARKARNPRTEYDFKIYELKDRT